VEFVFPPSGWFDDAAVCSLWGFVLSSSPSLGVRLLLRRLEEGEVVLPGELLCLLLCLAEVAKGEGGGGGLFRFWWPWWWWWLSVSSLLRPAVAARGVCGQRGVSLGGWPGRCGAGGKIGG